MSARRPWALPLVPLYRAAQALESALLKRGLPKTRALRWPVVSVGSLSAGGAGKTPVVIALAEMLHDAGWHVDMLSRGYGRGGKGVERVVTAEAKAAVRYGDEPVLIAQRTGVPVWVGADRFAAGSAAEKEIATTSTADSSASPQNDNVEIASGDFRRSLHLLDDGFQHRELARAFEIVLVTAEDLADTLLPAGNLREPLAALGRADAVVVREEEVAEVAKKIWPLLREGAQMWVVRRRLRFVSTFSEDAPLGVLTAGLRPLAFCAIARPEGFAASLTAAGCGIIDTVIFADHARYGERQLREIIAFGKQMNASGLVTTEKDIVKLSSAAIAQLEAEVGPVMVAALDATFVESEKVVSVIEAKLLSWSVPR